MSKYDYLHELYQALKPLDATERNRIMKEVEDKFHEISAKGDDETLLTDLLGSPSEYAKQFIPTDLVIAQTSQDSPETVIDVDSRYPLLTKLRENPEIEKRIYTSPSLIQRPIGKSNPIQILFTIFALFFLNVVFVVGPFFAVWGVVIAFVATGFALFISGIIIIVSGVLSVPLSFLSIPLIIMNHPVLLFSTGFLILGIGGLLSIAMIFTIHFLGMLTAKYFNWNLRIIRGF